MQGAGTRHRFLPVEHCPMAACRSRPPDRRPIQLEPLVEEVHETPQSRARRADPLDQRLERGLTVEADYDQLFRICLISPRNAVQAMESRASRDPGRDQIRIYRPPRRCSRGDEVSDTGPRLFRKGACASVRGLSRAQRAPAAPGSPCHCG